MPPASVSARQSGRPGVGVLVLLLGGVLEVGEVEGAGRAQDADKVGVFGELGVERGTNTRESIVVVLHVI